MQNLDDKVKPFVVVNDYMKCRVSNMVQIKDELTLFDKDEVFVLEIDIVADLRTIPEKYHEVFLNMLTSKFMGKVNFDKNPFSMCLKEEKKKWWNIFKR